MHARLYVVNEPNQPTRLIEANNVAQAVRYVAQRITAQVAKPMQVAELMSNGVEVERAGAA